MKLRERFNYWANYPIPRRYVPFILVLGSWIPLFLAYAAMALVLWPLKWIIGDSPKGAKLEGVSVDYGPSYEREFDVCELLLPVATRIAQDPQEASPEEKAVLAAYDRGCIDEIPLRRR